MDKARGVTSSVEPLDILDLIITNALKLCILKRFSVFRKGYSPLALSSPIRYNNASGHLSNFTPVSDDFSTRPLGGPSRPHHPIFQQHSVLCASHPLARTRCIYSQRHLHYQ